ncbi:Leucine Rich repeat-containing domain protein [Paragonimus heterotremus]|uniref:Leucine Rich repeat-containing domain protein n=1 Tax=Paragonimus heterotremus TaxID=100268 RepID=A0A8J4WCZ2_9TREM|nr:Leucine Rich repeat-containing domain protein [Paragonimus heterotremus]
MLLCYCISLKPQENVRLRQCDLSWNGFVGRAGIELARVVRENTKLSHLFLRGCRLEDQTLEAIGQGVLVASMDESQLELVDLSRNPFSTKAVSRLFFTLTQMTHTKMKCLLLEDVPIDCQCSQILMELNAKFSNMSIKHGPELIVGNTWEEVKVESGKFVSLFVLLREGIRYNRRRLVDILSEMDTERNNYVTLTQFTEALKKLPIRYRYSQLVDLLQSLDKLHNGTIYYG